jgi:hypothetical protein
MEILCHIEKAWFKRKPDAFFGGNSFGVYGGESSNVYVADTVGKEKL